MRTSRGYAKVRRGLLEHLGRISSPAVKLYVYSLLKAAPLGAEKGIFRATIRDIAADLGMNRELVSKAIRELETMQPKAFLQVSRAENQYNLTTFKILRFDPESAGRKNRPALDVAREDFRPAVRPAVRPANGATGNKSNSLEPTKNRKNRKNKGLSGAKMHAPPTFSCIHEDCPNQAWHKARVIAETQSLTFPEATSGLPSDRTELGRWLTGTKPLKNYADDDLAEFVRQKLAREPRWQTSTLLPRYVATDLPAFMKNRSSVGESSDLDDPLAKIEEQLGEKKPTIH